MTLILKYYGNYINVLKDIIAYFPGFLRTLENIQKNSDVILIASLSYDKAIQYAENKLKNDEFFLEKVLKNNPGSIKYIDKTGAKS